MFPEQLYADPAKGARPWRARPFKKQLLKWIGNKQRLAHEIIAYFPEEWGTYFEPFLGAGGVLGVLTPRKAIGSDVSGPLMEIWAALKDNPAQLVEWYTERWEQFQEGNRKSQYAKILSSYNDNPNGADLLFLCRACYGGVVRFRQRDGHMSTPCGVHSPIAPSSFASRVEEWHLRVSGTSFHQLDYKEAFSLAKDGDLIYCDPPYYYSQKIIYGAQKFVFDELLDEIAKAKARGASIALSIDGSKKSGRNNCLFDFPKGLFVREIPVNCGRSMLRRFQMEGQSLRWEKVADRLLLTY